MSELTDAELADAQDRLLAHFLLNHANSILPAEAKLLADVASRLRAKPSGVSAASLGWLERVGTKAGVLFHDTEMQEKLRAEILAALHRNEGAQTEAIEAARATEAKYMELLMAVACKWPDETRHQTALRYINERESAHHARGSAQTEETK